LYTDSQVTIYDIWLLYMRFAGLNNIFRIRLNYILMLIEVA